MRKLIGAMALAVGMACGAPATASYLDNQYVSGVLNTFEDQSREAFIDRGPNGTPDGVLGVGDVLIGFLRIDNKAAPGAVNYNNNIYAIFSGQIASSVCLLPTICLQTFVPTTVPGLRISDQVAGAPAGSIAAVFSSAAGIADLITTSPGGTMQDYFNAITGGMTLELITGFGGGATEGDDFFSAIANGTPGAHNAPGGIASLPPSFTVATFGAGLTIFAGFGASTSTYIEGVPTANVLTGLPSFHDLVISAGSSNGANGVANHDDWADASGFGGGPHAQCTDVIPPVGAPGALPCGFIDNADFTVLPIVVPEPGSVALLGLGLLGLAGIRRRVTRR